MSLITRCPACGTMFKVVPDQLRISDGWVRCGQCAEIFDATVHLQEPAAAAAQLAPSPASSGASPVLTAPLAAAPAPVAEPAAAAAATAPLPTLAPSPAAAPAPVDAVDSIAAPPLYPWFPSEVTESQLPRESQAQELEEEPDLDSVSFVRKARRQAMWRRPLVRTLLVLAMLLLGGLLALQYAVQERDKLAASQPQLRPWLQLMCASLRCEIQPPRQIDAIVIDSSSFNRLRTDAYRLSFSLRNQSPMQVAMPSLELTLTDSQDQPVIRSVLAPRDIGAAPVLPAAGETTSSVAISVATGATGNRIAGYRLLAFYP